jgi:hypothetical protein
VSTLRTYVGTGALIMGLLMTAFGSIEALGIHVSGDVSPGRSPAARVVTGVGLVAVSALLRRIERGGRAG